MPIDASPDDLDALRELVAQLSSERDAALDECRRVMEQNDRLRHLLQQLRRAQFGRKSERLDPEQLQLAIEDLETAVAAEDAAEQDKTAQSVETQKKKRRTNRGSCRGICRACMSRSLPTVRHAPAAMARCM